mmetsp:Transcript_3223/g.7661  ORF Transcript_3223/g.7661 Transcript_3223/m.7661 type:complete len:201 (-) Transcript_3223:492-1094(-)
MDERQVGVKGGIGQIQIVFRDLFGRKLSLVGNVVGGERIHVKSTFGTEHVGGFLLRHFADKQQVLFKDLSVFGGGNTNKDLFRNGLAVEGILSQHGIIDGNSSPTYRVQAFFLDESFHYSFAVVHDGLCVASRRKKDVSYRIFSDFRKIGTEQFLCLCAHEGIGHTKQHTGSVSGIGIASASSTVCHTDQHFVGYFDHVS